MTDRKYAKQNQAFKEQYSKVAIANLSQLLANSNCACFPVQADTSRGPAWLVHQAKPMASVVVIWDVHLCVPGAAKGPYLGTVRLEFGEHIDIQSTVKALHGIEAALHQAWYDSSNGAWPYTAKPLPAWCMAPEGSQ